MTNGGPEGAWRDWMQSLGRQMRRTREFLGLTQRELGQRAGVSQGAVSRFEGGRGLSAPFLGIVRLNVALARALRALEPSSLSEEAHRYLRYMEFLATPPEASEGREGDQAPLTDRPLTREPEGEAWMRLFWEVPPQQRPTLLQAVRPMVDALRG